MNDEMVNDAGTVDVAAINAANAALLGASRGGGSAAATAAWSAATAETGTPVAVDLPDSVDASKIVATRAALVRLAERAGHTVASRKARMSGTVWVGQRAGTVFVMVAPAGYRVTPDAVLV